MKPTVQRLITIVLVTLTGVTVGVTAAPPAAPTAHVILARPVPHQP
jgi:hypothetical protein